MNYIVEKKENRVLSFLLDDSGHAVEIHADALTDGPGIGDIYIGLVQKVAKNINAAFVEIIPGVSGYLPFDEIADPIYVSKGPSPDIQAGDQLVVQITREAFGHKDMSLSTKITLHGKYVVMVLGGIGLGISRKIPDDLRKTLKDSVMSRDEFSALQKRIGTCSVVVRTSAAGIMENASDDTDSVRKAVSEDLSVLEARITDLKLKAPYRSVHSCLGKQPPRWLQRIERLTEADAESVTTDDRDLYRQIFEAGSESPGSAPKLRLYDDPMVSMEKLYSLERETARALNKKVDLKGGGDLVIESTEALHIIDVNSGRSQSSKQKEEALLSVNLEAAREAARQIRLRNLSGIIVIDFINLKQQKNSLRILDELRKAVLTDPVKTTVVDMTKLGLVELTRKKIEAPLRDVFP